MMLQLCRLTAYRSQGALQAIRYETKMSLRLLSLWGLWWSAGLGARVEGLWARGGPLTQLLGRAQGMCRRLC